MRITRIPLSDGRTGEWITITMRRMDRTHLPMTAACPLCPSRPVPYVAGLLQAPVGRGRELTRLRELR